MAVSKKRTNDVEAGADAIPRSPTQQDLHKVRDILFGERARELEATLVRAERELAERISLLEAKFEAQIESLGGEMRQQNEAIARSLERAVHELRSDGMTRAQLSGLLQELAGRVNDETVGDADGRSEANDG